jgi:hypothetical protein
MPLRPIRPARFALVLACAVLGVATWGSRALAQGDLEKTPWATSMVYPVGDPNDFGKPAPGDQNGFSLSRGVSAGGRHHERHDGLDLANHETGSEVRAVAPGLVVCTRSHSHGWGNMLVLAHRLPGGDVLFSLFAHLLPGSISVHEGEIVALGQPLARVGRTGHATGPHLHLEFRTLTTTLAALKQPLAEAWERAAIVDPLRVFAAMREPVDHAGLPASLGSSVGTALAPPVAAPAPDALADAVAQGRLPALALAHGDEALTRGELYRLAYVEISPAGRAVPNRWTTLRSMLLARASGLPKAARAAFASDALPRRATDADRPASLAELAAVSGALDLVRAARPDVARPGPAPDRAALEAEFPQGARALVDVDRSAPALALPAGYFGPPSVTRRQACLLFAWTRAGKPGTVDALGADAQ